MAVNVGTLVWNAKVQGAGRANEKVKSMNESVEKTGQQTERTDAKLGFITGTLLTLGSTVSGLILRWTGLAAILRTAGTVIGGIVPFLTGVATWLAAGSAGALALAGAMGAAIGLFGVWILEVTGVLDAVRAFARWVGSNLPAAVTDGLLAVISIFAGFLAVLGGFVTGFVQGTMQGGFVEGIRQGVQQAGKVLDIFVGAWERTIARVTDLASGLGTAIGNVIGDAWNAVIPARIQLDPVSIAGQQVFGGASIDLPQLQQGGIIRQTGMFLGHAGEAVVPARADPLPAGAGGGGGTAVEIGSVRIGDQSLDISNLTRSELRDVVDQLAKLLGDEVGSRIS